MLKRVYLLDSEELLRALKDRRMQRGKFIFGVLALVMILLGSAVYIFAGALGIGSETAELIAIAFLIAGAVDYLILHFWDRIYNRMD